MRDTNTYKNKGPIPSSPGEHNEMNNKRKQSFSLRRILKSAKKTKESHNVGNVVVVVVIE